MNALTMSWTDIAESVGITYERPVEPVFVHDGQGLAALPVGARLVDADRVSGMIWVRTHRGWAYGWHGFPLEHYEAMKPASCYWTSSRLGEQDYGPFQLLNPETLGEFWPEWGSGDFKPAPKVENLHAGKRAVILGYTPGSRRWMNFPVEIVQWNFAGDLALVQPLIKRPDKFGYSTFYWRRSDLFLTAGTRG